MTERNARNRPGSAERLEAGPWSAELDRGVIHGVRVGDAEVAQRIYVAVRDPHWNTIPGELLGQTLSRRYGSIAATIDVRHRAGPVDFTWRGIVTVHEARGFTFTFEGRAETSFEYAKIGLNVHHPLEAMVGRRVRARTRSGWIDHTISPEIAPQLFEGGRFSAMFPEYDALEIETAPGAWTHFSFTGDVWEMQDHRNWTDANFKSYLSLVTPVPAKIEATGTIRQSIDVRVDDAIRTARPRPRRAQDAGIVVSETPAPRLPAIGIELDSGTLLPTLLSEELRSRFRPSYVRVPIRLYERRVDDDVQRAAEWLAASRAPAELAIFVPEDGSDALDALDGVLARRALDVVRFAVFDAGAERDGSSGSTRTATFELARRRLTSLAGVPAGLGTDRYFAELNRRPPSSAAVDFVTFTINPQVHDADDRTLFANIAAQSTVVEEARRISDGLPVVVGNVALVGRYGPFPAGAVRADGAPPNVDPRLDTPLAAAWTLASISHILHGAAIAASWFEVAGDRGIVTPRARPPLDVLVEVLELAGAQRVVASGATPDLACIASRSDAGLDLLVANLTADTRDVTVVGFTQDDARFASVTDRARSEAIPVHRRGAVVRLGPFEVARLHDRVGPS